MSAEFDFTVDDVIAQIKVLADERPEYVYRPPEGSMVCSYIQGRDGYSQGCIVGQALTRLGVPLEVLDEWESREPGGLSAADLLGELIGADERSEEVTWVGYVQESQDSGEKWGSAVREAGELP